MLAKRVETAEMVPKSEVSAGEPADLGVVRPKRYTEWPCDQRAPRNREDSL
jgi:hypothetical protein